jgi:hypothetical protein
MRPARTARTVAEAGTTARSAHILADAARRKGYGGGTHPE